MLYKKMMIDLRKAFGNEVFVMNSGLKLNKPKTKLYIDKPKIAR
jgi:hypothetical protein